MISLGFPGAFVAGVALAGLITALHFLAPHPPDRAPLPTARFLREDARTTLRFRRRPTDVPVWASRALLALLIGLLFAQPTWRPDREDGATKVVLLDRGAGMADVWSQALEAVGREAAGGNTRIVPFADGSDGAPAAVEVGALAALRPAEAESSYLAGLAALRVEAGDLATRSAEAVLITRPRWSAWDAQFAGLRDAAWPGELRVVAVGGAPVAEADVTPEPTRTAYLDAPTVPLTAALNALGYTLADTLPNTDTPPALRFLAAGDESPSALERVDAGDTLVLYGESAGAEPGSARFLRVGERTLKLAGGATGLAAPPSEAGAEGTTYLPIVLEDGAPIAVARPSGAGCLVRLHGSVTVAHRDLGYPHLIRALADGCRGTGQPAGATSFGLDSAAHAILEGEGAGLVDVAQLGLLGGQPLSRWLFLLVILVAGSEALLIRRASRARP